MSLRDERDTRVEDALVRESGDLLAYFRRRLSPEDAADALSETFASAWKSARKMPEAPEAARMWLFGVARNVLLHAQCGSLRREALSDRLKTLAATQEAPADAGIEVRDALARLGEEHAEVLRLVHWEGFPLVDVARHLGISDSTVRSRYQRAKEALRSELGVLQA